MREVEGPSRDPGAPIARVDAQPTPEEQLHERVKELRTLYRASRVLNGEPEEPISARLQEFIDTVPDGWLYPRLA